MENQADEKTKAQQGESGVSVSQADIIEALRVRLGELELDNIILRLALRNKEGAS